jgi:hypothetical protein
MKIKLIALVLTVLLVTSCGVYRAMIAQRGAEISDAALDSAIWTICNATPVGAITRRFNSPELRQAYQVICGMVLATGSLDVNLPTRRNADVSEIGAVSKKVLPPTRG